MTQEEYTKLHDRATALFNSIPPTAPDKHSLHRTTVIALQEVLSIHYYKQAELQSLHDRLASMRSASKMQAAEIERLNQLLSGTTTPTIAAQSVGRGIDENEPREG